LVSAWFTHAFGAHYPLLYQHRDAAEAERCLETLQRLAPLAERPGPPVLDLGCGDGRHLELLCRLGYSVVGLDLSAHLVEIAGARNSCPAPLRVVRGDMRRLPFADRSFAAVLSLFTAFGYFGPPAANREPVREVARSLQTGGRWFLDYFDGDRVRAELGSGRPKTRERDVGPLAVRETRRLDPVGALVTKEVELVPRPGKQQEASRLGIWPQGLRYTEQVALFTLGELDAMAASQGLVRVAAAGGYECQDLGAGTRWILVYRKT
jgi:SAM-dependent methyltransferase